MDKITATFQLDELRAAADNEFHLDDSTQPSKFEEGEEIEEEEKEEGEEIDEIGEEEIEEDAEPEGQTNYGPASTYPIYDYNIGSRDLRNIRDKRTEKSWFAKGLGGYGYFESTNREMTKYSAASLFNERRVPVTVRFSHFKDGASAADTVRDFRGFDVKFHTQDGQFDVMGYNAPAFLYNDPNQHNAACEAHSRNERTNLHDYGRAWKYYTENVDDTIYGVTWVHGDNGIPAGYENINGYSFGTYELLQERHYDEKGNRNGEKGQDYARFVFNTDQGTKWLDENTAEKIRGEDPDYYSRNWYNKLDNGGRISWTLHALVMDSKTAKTSANMLDATKVWSPKDYRAVKVGRLVINRTPARFKDLDYTPFNPLNKIKGVDFGNADLINYMGALFAEETNQRLGHGYQYRPDPPLKSEVLYQTKAEPESSSNEKAVDHQSPEKEVIVDYTEEVEPKDLGLIGGEFKGGLSQARGLYKSYSAKAKNRLYTNIARYLKYADSTVQRRALNTFGKVDREYANGVRNALKGDRAGLR